VRPRLLICVLPLAACARPNLHPEWIRTAGSAYGCPPARLARADTSRSFAGLDPRLFDVGTTVCEVIALADLPGRVTPDRRNAGSVREAWTYTVKTGQGVHTVTLTMDGPTRREMVVAEMQDVANPAAVPAPASGGRRGRG
jgi:hypothetical protein